MPFHYRLGKMVNCSACSGIIHRNELVSAAFSQEGKRSYYHKGCEEKAEYLSRWREEAAWAFRPVRLSVTEWEVCSSKKVETEESQAPAMMLEYEPKENLKKGLKV